MPLLERILQVSEDITDPNCQRMAFQFLGRSVLAWGRLPEPAQTNGNDPVAGQDTALPGFEHFIYERILPLAFRVPASPGFNVKDGQVLVVRCRSFFYVLAG